MAVQKPDTSAWFDTWFDSPYYHILYQHRDHEEAEAFMDALHAYFRFRPADKIMDLACGKGRHSIYLNRQGLDVTGLDLSEQNIAYARQFANERLHFYVHDMRHTFQEGTFDYVLNLFTSFGYFEQDEENQEAICAAARALKKEGRLLIDFLNPYTVIHKLVPEEVKTLDGIEFHITKHLSKDNYIVKDIRFVHEGKKHHYQERVKAIDYDHFLSYFKAAGLQLEACFGDYALGPFRQESSDRMIFVLRNQAEAAC
jgi:SAM-dependent methyltransferase